ncbi:MAG: hypothetical protein ACC631_06650 [Halocynthiibacter sp.]
MRKTLFLNVLLFLGACAQTANQIAPEVTSAARYSDWQCPALVQENSRVNSALTVASETQNQAVVADVLTVFFIGIPFSGGGNPEEISNLKGRQIELRSTLETRQCS